MADLQRTLFGVPSAAMPPMDLIEQRVSPDDRIQFHLRVPVEIDNSYVTVRLDGLVLNVNRWMRHKLGHRIRVSRGHRYPPIWKHGRRQSKAVFRALMGEP